jgi:heterodisulfide reductase subunit B
MSEPRVVSPDELMPVVPNGVFLFRSCTGSLEYPGTENAAREVLGRLGVEVVMDPDQTCCSGYLLTCSAYPPEFSLAVTARNFSLAEKRGLDVFTFCNGCYAYNRELRHLLEASPETRDVANEAIGELGHSYRGTAGIYHVQELYYRMLDTIVDLVVRPLNGLRVGVHYGCHYVAQQYSILDDGGYPTFHEEIIEALGGTPVFYRERQACCGYSVGRGFTHKEETVQPHLSKKMQSAKDEGVEMMTTVCPGCNVALDREQPRLQEKGYGEFSMPVIDLGQLIAVALGVDFGKLGFAANTTAVEPVLARRGIKETS